MFDNQCFEIKTQVKNIDENMPEKIDKEMERKQKTQITNWNKQQNNQFLYKNCREIERQIEE